jgi:flagellin-specific chaperone FliS
MSVDIYRSTHALTADPEQAVSRLFQKWTVALHEAGMAIERGDIPAAHRALVLGQTLCGFLWSLVNTDHPLGEKTAAVLAFLHEEQVRANVEKSAERCERVREVVAILADTWELSRARRSAEAGAAGEPGSARRPEGGAGG